MNRRTRSFHLKKGYMVTFATASDCSDYSRVFIADKEDLWIESLPDILDQGIAFIRVMPWNWVSKKGWCKTGNAAITQGNQLECTWFYNWDAQSTRDHNLEYVPEKWGLHWPSFSTIKNQNNVSHLIGHNEPDHTEQSNVTVDQAVAQWPELMKTGLRLGAPATTDFSWLYDFMSKCKSKNYRVDFVVIHAYWGGLTAQQWYNQLKEVHDKTGCAIWIKEWNNGADWTTEWWPDGWADAYAKQKKELAAILNVMDTAHFVERYSLYNDVGWKRFLIDKDGKNTPAGDYYRDNKPTFAYNPINEVVPKWSNKSFTINNITQSGDTASLISWNNRNGGLVDYFKVFRKDNSGDYIEIAQLPRYMEKYNDVDGAKITGTSTYKVQSVMRSGSVLNSGELLSVKSMGITGLQYYNPFISDINDNNISFKNSFSNTPIVILGASSYSNGASLPFTSRIKEVTKGSVVYAIEPWNYLSNKTLAKAENLPFLAIESGSHDFGGLKAESGEIKYINTQWTNVKFENEFNEIPAIFTTLNSTKSSVPVITQVRNVTTEGFEVCVKAEKANTAAISRQNINYLAITPGVGRIGNHMINVGITEQTIGDVANTQMVLFNSTFVNPLVYANTQTVNDDITATVKYGSLSSTQVKLFRHKETSVSSDISLMAKESVGYLIIETDEQTTTSVQQIENNIVTIYPTIVTDIIKVSGIDINAINQIKIFDSFGKIIVNSIISDSEVDLSYLNKRIYFIKINNEQNVSIIKR